MEIIEVLNDMASGYPENERRAMFSWLKIRIKQAYNEELARWKKEVQRVLSQCVTSLPNAHEGKPYEQRFVLPKQEQVVIEGASWTDKDCGMELGLQPDGSLLIKGSPKGNGGLSLQVRVRHLDMPEDLESMLFTVNLTVIPNPRSLWRELPVPSATLFKKPDEQACRVPVAGGRTLIGASKRGRSHAHEGRSRDDDFKLTYLESGWYILAVADGAGSATYSREGARLACEVAVRHCEEYFAQEEMLSSCIAFEQVDSLGAKKAVRDQLYLLLAKGAFKAYKAIEKLAEERKFQTKQFATTLLLTVCRKFEFGWFIGSFWIGDGAIAVYQGAEHKVTLMGKPDGSEYAGQTRFITMPELFADANGCYGRLRYTVVPDFTAVMLMTDGVSDPKFSSDNALQEAAQWDALWEDIRHDPEHPVDLKADNAELQLLDWLDFWSQGNHDDRTIAMLY